MPASVAMNLTGRVDPIAAKVRPVDEAATALFAASDRARHGQPLGLDVAEIEALLDQGIETLLRERAHEVVRGIAHGVRNAGGDMTKLLSGETSFSASRCAAELLSARAQLALVRELLDREARPAA